MGVELRKGVWLCLGILGWAGGWGCSPAEEHEQGAVRPPLTGDYSMAKAACGETPAVPGWAVEHVSTRRCPMYAVLSVSATDVWIAGDRGQLYRWDGHQFQPQSVGMEVDLRRLWASGPDDVWAGGLGGALLRFDGTQWLKVPSPIQGDILALTGSGPTDIWVLAFGRQAQLSVGSLTAYPDDHEVWHWDGTSWSRQAGLAFASTLAVAGPGNVWVGATSPDYKGLTYHWDGASWTALPLEQSGHVSSLAAVSPNELWAIVTERVDTPAAMVDTIHFKLYRFDGTAWEPERFPDPSSDGDRLLEGYSAHGGRAELVSVEAVRGAVWLRGSYDRRALYWDGGRAALFRREGTRWHRVVSLEGNIPWMSSDALLPDRRWTEVHLDGSAPDDVWIDGFNGQLFHWDGARLTSHWLWKPQPMTAMWGAPSGELWAVGGLGTVLRRTSAGWTESQTGIEEVQETFTWISGHDDGDLWAGGPDAPTIHWDGNRWTQLTFEASTGYAVGPDDVFLGTSDQGLWRVTGGQWTRELPSESTILSIIGGASSGLWVVCKAGERIHLYRFDGAWHAVPLPMRRPHALWEAMEAGEYGVPEVRVTPAGDVLMLRGGLDGLYLFNGRGWQRVTKLPSGVGAYSFWAESPSDIWLLTNLEGGLVHYDGKSWTRTGPAAVRGVFSFQGELRTFGSSGAIYRKQP